MTEATGGRRYYNCKWAQEDVETLYYLLDSDDDDNNNNNNNYLLQLSFHSMAVVLTLVQTKQIRIITHK